MFHETLENGKWKIEDGSLLADVGNSRIHIYDGKSVEHLLPDEAIERFGRKRVLYTSVNHHLESRLKTATVWKNISDMVHIPGEYDTMGVDRRALCLSHDNGVFVDAGSAITVDVMERGIYKGGFIYPGLKALLESYARISPVLDTVLDTDISLTELPRTTKGQISYGIIAPIKTLIETLSQSKPLYITGGDGETIAGFFANAVYDETLVFKGMVHALRAGVRN